MPRDERSGGHKKREQIRHAAYLCFRDHGYHETSVDAVCRAAGVSKGSFYYHYASKQECFMDILETWTREVMSEVQKQFEGAVLTDEPFLNLAEALRRESHRGRSVVPLWLEFSVLSRLDPGIRDALSRFYHRARLAIVEMLRPFQPSFFAPGELDGIAASIFGAYFGILVQDLSDPSGGDAGQAMGAMMSVFHRIAVDREAAATGAAPVTVRSVGPGARADEAELDSLLAPSAPSIRRRVTELRELVQRVAPIADERVIGGWKVVAYDHGGLFCYIKPLRDGVDLGFHHGAELDDPAGLLTGTGKRMRRVRLAPETPLPIVALEPLVAAALDRQSKAS